MQFFHILGQCFHSNELRLGHAVEPLCVEYSQVKGKCVVEGLSAGYEKASSVKSGWIMKRVYEALKEMDTACQSL
ncbi:hypothetical protein F5Y06DRAFT_281508, partial [Hypoxylon sp. FL0890]